MYILDFSHPYMIDTPWVTRGEKNLSMEELCGFKKPALDICIFLLLWYIFMITLQLHKDRNSYSWVTLV